MEYSAGSGIVAFQQRRKQSQAWSYNYNGGRRIRVFKHGTRPGMQEDMIMFSKSKASIH